MTSEIFKPFPGGLNIAVSPLFWDVKDQGTIAAIKECLQQVARAHGAEYKDEYLQKVNHLLSTGMMKGYVMKAHWQRAANEACVPRTIALALGSEAIILKKSGGRLLPSLVDCRDDTAILKQSLSKLLRECPEGMHRPRDLHLSQYMEEEIAGFLQKNSSVSRSIGTLAEVSRDNTLIMRVMKGVNAEIGSVETGEVLELTKSIPLDRWQVKVVTQIPTANEANRVIGPHFFTTRRELPGAEIGAAFSLCPSSMSKSVPHVHVASLGNIPDGKELEDILASLLTAGQEHISLRQEREQCRALSTNASPIINIHAGRQKAWQSLIGLSGREIFMQLPHHAPLFGEPLSELRISCFEEKLHRALQSIDGMKVRQFGDYPLYPVFLDNEAVTKNRAARPEDPLSVIQTQTLDLAA